MRTSDVERMITMMEENMKPVNGLQELRREYELKLAAEKQVVDGLLKTAKMLDEEGYPTKEALTIIELWPYNDPHGWFIFINSIWYMKSFGWNEGETDHDYIAGKKVYLYELSTAGWSGNESIIRAMENNESLWHFAWVQSRRGGHYIFERDLDE